LATLNVARKLSAAAPAARASDSADTLETHPLVSLVVPAYNEAAILEQNLTTLCRHMESLEDSYKWELVVVNDGSSDATGSLAEQFARNRPNVRVFHHVANLGIGKAFQLAFGQCRGDYVVALDLDLSYSPDHIERLLAKMRQSGAKIVVASPYMRGGQVSHVPWLRRILSVTANRFLSRAAKGSLSTLTSMVRAYDGQFLRTLNLTSNGMEINPEIIYKGLLLRAPIEEIPSHLNWHLQVSASSGPRRRSSLRLARQVMAVLMAGYLFRPVMFFILPGLVLFTFALYVNAWMLIHFLNQYPHYAQYTWFFSRSSAAVAAAYAQAPHTFIIGLTSTMLAIQLLSLGILALQSQRYFEEIFHLGTTIYGQARRSVERQQITPHA